MAAHRTTQRTHHHYHDKILQERLKKLTLAIVLIPTLILVVFIFFGPSVGSIFGFFSKNRGNTGTPDTIAPPAPIFTNAPKAVNQKSLKLEGFAESGATIKLFVNGPEKTSTVAASDGTFSFEDIELISGRNSIFAKATDQNGNESEKSVTLTIEVDEQKPRITVEEPKNGDIIKNLNKRITIKGKINEKATIKINDKLVVQKPDFTFEFILGVEEGTVEIKVSATDEAGNTETEELTITYLNQS